MATERQKRAVKNLAENGGIVSKAMRDAGYTKISSATPKKLTSSKGYEELMKKYLPDSLLAKKHQALLNKEETVRRTDMNGDIETVKTGEIDVMAVTKGLDMAYKLKGRYVEKVDVTSGGLPIQISEVIAKKNKIDSNEGSN